MLERNARGKLSSGQVLEPKKGAEHYGIPSFAGILSGLYFLLRQWLRTVGPKDFLFLTHSRLNFGLNTHLRPVTSPDAPYVGSLSIFEFGASSGILCNGVWVSVLLFCTCKRVPEVAQREL